VRFVHVAVAVKDHVHDHVAVNEMAHNRWLLAPSAHEMSFVVVDVDLIVDGDGDEPPLESEA